MKIIFAPNYFYLNIPVFEQIISKLSEKGVTSYVLRLPGNIDISFDRKFDSFYFKNRKINFIEVPVFQTPYRNGIFSKIKLLISALKNWKVVREIVRKLNPDVAVVGSDLGNLNIRFLVDACCFYHIPVVILYSCDVPEFCNRNIFNFFYSSKNKYTSKSRILNFLRAVSFRGTTPGEYALNSTICVISEDIRQKLISRGVDENRIFVTGMPLSNASVKCPLKDVFKRLGIPNNHKLVVFFTEHIQNIYGTEYTKDLYFNLEKAIKGLDRDIFFLVKLHPLDSKEFKIFIRNIFSKRHKVIEDFAAEDLIAASDLCLSFFSRVLITASLMGKRFLSINFRKDRKRTFISDEEGKILEITSPKDLKKNIEKALKDPEYGEKIDKTIGNIAKRFFSPDSSEKIASIILNRTAG